MSEEDFLTPRERAALERNPEASLASQASTDDEILENEAIGVGGLLALLVAILIFIGPTISVFQLIIGHQEMLTFSPELERTSEWRTILTLDWTSLIAQIALSILAGLLLFKRHVPSTKWIVIGLIWLSALGVSGVSLMIADGLFPGVLTASDVGATVGRPVIFSMIWTLYLLLSKRVRRTYSSSP